MTRYSRPSTLAYSFGPGPVTPAVKWIIWANVAAFVATLGNLLWLLSVRDRRN